MVARPSTPYRSANAGEFSAETKGRVDVKQYYSAGLAYKNVEPVPQSGFRQMGGTWRNGFWRRPLAARAISAPSLAAGPHVGTQTIWTGTVAGTVAVVRITDLAITAGNATFSVEAETSAGVWTLVAGPFAVPGQSAESRVAGFAPGAQREATALRIRATFSTAATVSIGSVLAYYENGSALAPRFCDLQTDDGETIVGVASAGHLDFFSDAGFVGCARIPALAGSMLPDLDFYAEGRTIGVFHGQLPSVRLFLVTPGQLHDWRNDLWLYAPAPKADLGGVYPKTSDIWELFIRWSSLRTIFLSLTVNGETTPSIPTTVVGAPGVPAKPLASGDWDQFALDIQAALIALPTIGAGVTVTAEGGDGSQRFVVTFGGALSGEEFDLSAIITNTADISVLPYHTQIGKTDKEPLFSVSRGWPGTLTLVQDRMGYARIPAASGALALSRIAEYFDLNIDSKTDNAARLDLLRSQTSETIVSVKESKYVLAFTDRGVYFANNRTIERNQPLNFVLASETGAQPNCRPFDLEGEVYYVGIGEKGLPFAAEGGAQLLSIVYDDVSTSYNATPKSLLASHLVDRVTRTARQRRASNLDATKGWLMRSDGRLIAAQIVSSQEITGFCEWIAASGGLVRDIRIDGRNRLWLAVERGAMKTVEIYDMDIFLQDAVRTTTDLAGQVSGLSSFEGAVVWAVADGYVIGPRTVVAGSIDLEDPYVSVIVGRWQPPRWESMPQVHVTPADDVVFRPGRIHTANVNVLDTTSIAVGANGAAAEAVSLGEAGDPTNQPMPGKTKLLTVTGLTGFQEGPTLVITQTRPGRLRVRDLAIGAKL